MDKNSSLPSYNRFALAKSLASCSANRIWTWRVPAESKQSVESSKEAAGALSELKLLRAENDNLQMLLFG